MKIKSLGGVWYMFSNNNFQFLNNITRIFTYFFIHTYFHKCFQKTKHMFLSACTKHPPSLQTQEWDVQGLGKREKSNCKQAKTYRPTV